MLREPSSAVLLRTSADAIQEAPPPPDRRTTEAFLQAQKHRLTDIAPQRAALLDARDNGTFDADVLASSQVDPEIRARTAR